MPIISKITLGVSPLPTSKPRYFVSAHAVIAPPDTTPPILSGPFAVKTGTSTANVSVITNESGGTLYFILTVNPATPTAAQISSGHDATGAVAKYAGFIVSPVAGTVPSSATGLAASTTYYTFFVQYDGAGNISNIVGASAIVTDAVVVACDPYWDRVVLLASLSGPVGTATTPTDTHMVDESPAAHGLAFTTLANATFTSASVLGYGSSVHLPGGGSRFTWPDSNDWNLSNRKYTIEYWFRPASTTFGFHIAQWSDSAGDLGWVLDSAGNYAMSVSTTGADNPTNWAGGTIVAGTWYPACTDFDGVKYRAYINGVMVASSTTLRTVFNSGQTLNFGAGQLGAFGYVGDFQEVRITMDQARYASDAGYTPTTVPFPRTFCTCAEANAFLVRAPGLDLAHRTAYQSLICGLVTDGVWPKLDVLHVYATQTETVALLNLVSSSYAGTLDGSTHTFTADRGFQAVGGQIGAFNVNTNFNPTTAPSPKYTRNSAHVSAWGLTTTDNINFSTMGVDDGTSVSSVRPRQAGLAYFWANNATGNNNASVATPDSAGLYLATRNSSSQIIGYKNNAAIVTDNASTSAPVPNLSLYTVALHTTGAVAVSTNLVSAASIGAGLSAADVGNLYNRLCTYLNTMGVPCGVCSSFNAGWLVSGVPAVFDPTTAILVTMSGGNLVATSQTTNGDTGVTVAAANAKTSGKWYWEITLTVVDGGWHEGVGICTPGTPGSLGYGNAQLGNIGAAVFTANIDHGQIYANSVAVGNMAQQGNNGDVWGIACDLDNYKIWFRVKKFNSSVFTYWNNDATADPTSNTNGITIPPGAMVPFVKMGGFSGGGAVYTANFGASPFVGDVPVCCPEADAFLARTTGLDVVHTNAYHALICGLVADGVWSKLDVLRVYATQTSAIALLNLKSSSYSGILHGAPTFTADRGFTGVEASSAIYIDSQFNPTTAVSPNFVQNTAHMSVWQLNDWTGNPPLGAGDANAAWMGKNAGNYFARINGAGGAGANLGAASTLGHIVGTRNGAFIAGYKNGVFFNNATYAATGVPNLNFYEIAANFAGAFGNGGQTSALSWGGLLTATDAANLYARLRTYMTAVGVP